MKVGFIGTGKLGGPVSEAMAESGNEVFAYDIAGGKNISSASNKEGGSRKYFKTIKSVVQKSSIVFIAVPTPHSEEYDGSLPCMDLEPKDFDRCVTLYYCRADNQSGFQEKSAQNQNPTDKASKDYQVTF